MVKNAVVVEEQKPISLEDVYESVEELLGVMNEIKEQQAEIIEKLDNVGLPGTGFRVFDVDEQ